MALSDQVVDNAVEEYMVLMQRMESLAAEALTEKEGATPERQKELDERIGDIAAIRDQMVSTVKQSGISRDVLEQAARLLSIF
ncbi:MAG: hypothetical protein C4527_16455 [Candidatus Omnitrophota bacterium]|jgi:hypothetical protein|nr:MAG: hypothetical protein C4527_16455 [Candidatus Omnitrophota bacterium]